MSFSFENMYFCRDAGEHSLNENFDVMKTFTAFTKCNTLKRFYCTAI